MLASSLSAITFPADSSILQAFSLKFSSGGAHISRTMVLAELDAVLTTVPVGSDVADYRDAILKRNVLGKTTDSTRQKSLRQMGDLPVSLYCGELYDGIVCLSATKGEAPAAEGLRALLTQALGKPDLPDLLASAGPKGSKAEALEEWLRDEFFEQHCALFHHRPFIWHIWDGHKSGFSALVNYHKLDYTNLEKLTYSYLGNWIQRQQAAVDAGEAGSDARLQAAKQLQARLKLILEGEPPYDIFVCWKPLSQQAIGWHPDLNDGVRMNIRSFMAVDIPGGKKGAGILRTKPNIKWEKDRGKEPVRVKAEFPWFWGWDEVTQDFAGVGKEPDGNRWNGCHYSNGVKQAARISQK